MCGISGYISDRILNGQQMAKSLQHRGPDDFGEYQASIGGKNVYLAHNRLSIIDLSTAGHQPMTTGDENIVIVYNGEVYNFEALRDKYLKGVRLQSKTDTEVILYLHQLLGINFVNELNGDFSICLIDKVKSKAYLIRDRLGVKPLYYSCRENQLLFGSEIKALLASGLSFSLNEGEVQNYLVFKYSPGDKTLFKGIHRLPPAHFLEYDIPSGNVHLRKYWEVKKDEVYRNFTYSEQKEELDCLLRDSVKIRLMSDVPVGTFFSGGVDSSIIAGFLKDVPQITHYTAKKSQTDIKAEGTTSDFYYAQVLAKQWNLNLVPVDISAQEANSSLISKTIYYSDDLIADGSQIPSYLITRGAKASSTVMLSGMGADELFFGYKSHQLIQLSNFLDHFPRFISAPIADIFSHLNQGKGMFKAYRRHLHQFGKYYAAYPSIKYGLFGIVGDYENAVSVLNRSDESSIDYISGYFDGSGSVFDQNFRFEKENFLVKNLHYVDRMCMANGVEGRVPFLDHRIVEFAYNLPVSSRISRLGKTKVILKDTYNDLLPSNLMNRRKAGFGMPLRSIFSSKEKVYELLDKEFFAALSLFSSEGIDRLVANHVSGKEDNAAIIYALISFQEWYKIFIKG